VESDSYLHYVILLDSERPSTGGSVVTPSESLFEEDANADLNDAQVCLSEELLGQCIDIG